MLSDAGSHICGNILEVAVAEIFVDYTRVFVSLAEVVFVDLRIDVSVDLNDVLPAVVVVVDKATSPGYVAIVDANAGCRGQIAEGPVAVVVIEVAGVIGEVGLEDVEPAVTVVIGQGDTHSCLLVAVVVEGDTGHHRDVGEGAVMVVLEENA